MLLWICYNYTSLAIDWSIPCSSYKVNSRQWSKSNPSRFTYSKWYVGEEEKSKNAIWISQKCAFACPNAQHICRHVVFTYFRFDTQKLSPVNYLIFVCKRKTTENPSSIEIQRKCFPPVTSDFFQWKMRT